MFSKYCSLKPKKSQGIWDGGLISKRFSVLSESCWKEGVLARRRSSTYVTDSPEIFESTWMKWKEGSDLRSCMLRCDKWCCY